MKLVDNIVAHRGCLPEGLIVRNFTRPGVWFAVGLSSFALALSGCSASAGDTTGKGSSVGSVMTDEEKFIKLARQETSLPLISDDTLIKLAKSACTTLTNGGTVTDVLISIMDNIPSGDQEDVIRTVGFGISAFCPDQSSKVSG